MVSNFAISKMCSYSYSHGEISCWNKSGTSITQRLQEAEITGSWLLSHTSLECRVQGVGVTLLGHAGIQVPSLISVPFIPRALLLIVVKAQPKTSAYSHSQLRRNENLIFFYASKQKLQISLFGENEQFLIVLKLHSLDPFLSV